MSGGLTVRVSRIPAGSLCQSRQGGVTLLETLIALALSAVVVIGMVVLMGNSMWTANRITQSSQLNDQLRNVMSMLTRDVRRANITTPAHNRRAPVNPFLYMASIASGTSA